MSTPIPRLAAIAVLVIGVGAIVWSAVRSDNDPTVAEVRAAEDAAPDEVEPDPWDGEPIPIIGEAPTLEDLDGWLNTEATSLEEIRSDAEVTIVQFWTFACRNCKNTLDALSDIYEEFGDRIEIVGVHAPEFSFEADVDNIIEAAADLGVTWPIALDTNKRNFHDWQEGPTAYWPTVYLIDSDNQLRMAQRGDSPENYLRLADYVERLLAGEA